MSFVWKTLQFNDGHSFTKEEGKNDRGKGIHSCLCLYTFSTGDKSSLLMPRGEDPFITSLSGILFKYDFHLNAKDKGLVSCIGLNMAFLSWYFWTHIFFLHYLMTIFPLSFPMMCENGTF